MKLRESKEYKEWVTSDVEDGGTLVLERDIYGEVEPQCLVSVVKRGDKYSVYRTFGLGSAVAVSADLQDVFAELVFESLFDRYSSRVK